MVGTGGQGKSLHHQVLIDKLCPLLLPRREENKLEGSSVAHIPASSIQKTQNLLVGEETAGREQGAGHRQ